MKYIILSTLFLLSFLLGHSSIVIQNGLTHQYTIDKNVVYKGKIQMLNTGDKIQNVKLYLQDLSYNAAGTVNYSPPMSHARSNTGWIKIETSLVQLKANEKKDILYEIHVPKDSLLAGSHWGVIIVEPTDDYNPAEKKTGITISSVVRYAIQIITNYQSDQLKANLSFKGIKLSKVEGRRILNIALANTGDIFLSPIVSIDFYNPNTGAKLGSFSSIKMGLLPNNSKTFNIDISSILAGNYKTVLLATDKDDNAFAVNVALEIKND